jgi:diadenosine tetraphosphatase ApaH/serine/threonine PP2A family protein phosphatase
LPPGNGAVDQFPFCGHTHLPGIFTQERFYDVNELENAHLSLNNGGKFIVNVGSVGQPRDRDPKGCYVERDRRQIIFQRVPYNVEKRDYLSRSESQKRTSP